MLKQNNLILLPFGFLFTEDTIHALPTPSITSVFSGTNFLDVNWKPPLKDYLHVIVGFILGEYITRKFSGLSGRARKKKSPTVALRLSERPEMLRLK